MPERALLLAALLSYAAAWLASWSGSLAAEASRRRGAGWVLAALAPHRALGWLGIALVLHTAALASRWATLGHGPFTTMHEILSSSLWSLSLVIALAARVLPRARAAMRYAFPVTALLASWMLLADPAPGHLPPTYDTILLYLHTLVGKLFLGLLLAATAIALQGALAQRCGLAGGRLSVTPVAGAPPRADDDGGDAGWLAYRFASFALVFDTLLLIVGAVWAQDAWGRYWAWDPLETWSFLTWLALAATLHARVTFRPTLAVQATCYALVFAIAFLTFFGVPYLSTSPHKGAL